MQRRTVLKMAALSPALYYGHTLAAFAAPLAPGQPWPRRALIDAIYENSLDARYTSKPVLESRLIDDMETDHSWSTFGIGTMSYTTDRAKAGKRSLRFRTSLRDEAHLRANFKNGSFTGEQGGSAGMRLDLTPPQDWTHFNRIALWVYVHPTSMQIYSLQLNFDCAGAPQGSLDPVASHVVQNLIPGEWNRVVWEIPQNQRDRVTSLSLGATLTGHGPEDEGIVTYDFDQITLDRVDAEPYEGWQVAPGKIAFQHVGYRPSDQKLGFTSNTSAAHFTLIDAATGKTAATFPTRDVSNRRGNFQALDFTTFTKPGRYYLRCGETHARPFSISEDLWFSVIEKALNFYYGQRCGFDVPGIHHVCHQDWQGTHNGVTKIINGGWHDAGDLSQGPFRTGGATYAMLQIYDQLQQKGVEPALQTRLLEEARWGLDWLLKTRFGAGFRITWARMRMYTDNKVGTVDDVIVPAQNIAFENFLFATTAASAARLLKTIDPTRSSSALAAAEEDYAATLHQHEWTAATREEASFGTLASVELFRATARPLYAEEAAHFGRLLIECQEQTFVEGISITGYFYTNTQRTQRLHDHHSSFEETPVMALRALCETFPDHPDWMDWYAAALLHSEYFQQQGTAISAPYGLIPNSVWHSSELVDLRSKDPEAVLTQFNAGTRLGSTSPSAEYRLRVFPIWVDNLFHGNTAVHMAGTASHASAALLRNSALAQDVVRRQLQWVFGGNPFSQSLMYGEGYDFQPLFAYCTRDLTGALPVGMDSRKDDSPYWPAENRATYKEMWVVPVSRLLFSLASIAMPAQITGTASAPTKLREARTGATIHLPTGPFTRTVPPGNYTLSSGARVFFVSLLAGGRYNLADIAHPIQIDLTVVPARETGELHVTARLTGSGLHSLQLRTFNAATPPPPSPTTLSPGHEQTLTWTLKVTTPHKPWAIVAIADNNPTYRQDFIGTFHPIQRLE
ncbi:MAG TPA: glycoside hydrolase family 9 protein [Acidobacteriaceae bacterium]|nr:glycoside hydrolase family 9 protein [Acidobacteriaceae bacterium]